MKHHVLFIQGGGEGAYDADQKLANSLQESLGDEYAIHYPAMPDEGNPDYEAWKTEISNTFDKVNGDIIAVGHSLGGSMLLKYLAETPTEPPVAAVFLISTPYWGADGWQVEEYTLQPGFADKLSQLPLFFYHSLDDEIVPFSHLSLYEEQLPHAALRQFDSRDHQFNNDLSDVAADIIRLKAQQSENGSQQ